MPDKKVQIDIVTTGDTSGAEKVIDAEKKVVAGAGETGSSLENQIGGKKGILDDVARGLAKSLSESLGLSGEIANSFEGAVAPALRALGPLALAVTAGLAAKAAIDGQTDATNKASATADKAGFAQKKLSDETLGYVRNAKSAADLTKKREQLENDLTQAQQEAAVAQTESFRKGNEQAAADAVNKVQQLSNLARIVGAAEKAKQAEEAITASQKTGAETRAKFDAERVKRETAQAKELAASQKIAAEAEALRLKPINYILSALDEELKKRKELQANYFQNSAQAVANSAANKISPLQNKVDSLTKQRENTIEPELRAEYDSAIQAAKNQIERATSEAKTSLQAIAVEAAKLIGDSAAPNLKTLTDTTQVAVDAQKSISQAATGLQTAVAEIPAAVAPITEEVEKITGALSTAFGSILSALSSQNTTITGLQKQINALSVRIHPPGK